MAKTMHIIQIGLPKSGNFWLYNILDNIIKEANFEYKSFIKKQPIYEVAKTWDLAVKKQIDINMLDITNEVLFYRIGTIFRYPIDNIDDYINNCTHIWNHSQVCSKTFEVLEKIDKIVYIIRDPRDIAISWSKFVFTPYMRKYYHFLTSNETDPETYLMNNLKVIIADWINHVGGYLSNQKYLKNYIIFYERLLKSFDRELEQLLEYLEIELSKKSISNIKEKVEFDKMKQENPHHVRKGGAGQWIDILTDEQKKIALQMGMPLLKLLNYPLDEQVDILPKLPVKLPEEISLPSGRVVLLKPSHH